MSMKNETWAEKVLGIIRQRVQPVSAYGILEELRSDNPKMAPTTVYRALNTLMEKGSVHRIESLNAYVACADDGHHHPSIMSICGDCGTVDERDAPAVFSHLSSALGEAGFTADHHVIEVHGLCADCKETEGES